MFAGVDLGCNAGVSVLDKDGSRLYSDTWKLGKRSPSSLYQFQQKLYDTFSKHCVEYVGYELVTQEHRSRVAAVVYGSFEGILWSVCFDLNVPAMGVHVQTLKKFMNIGPRPEKEDIEAAAMVKWHIVPSDDNEADSLFIADYTRKMVAEQGWENNK